MSHHEPVTGLRPHTKDYDAKARERLGTSVVRAREGAGWSRTELARRAPGAGTTSLWKLESGKPVSASVYESVARALPHWDIDTPKRILDGDDPPSVEDTPQDSSPPPESGPIDPLRRHVRREIAYFALRLKDDPDDINRLRDLLTAFHELATRENPTQGE